MSFILSDRVKETTTTTGTGTLSLAGAEVDFQSFVAGIGDSNICYYCCVHCEADEWEVGFGTVNDAATNTLSRDTILASSKSSTSSSSSVSSSESSISTSSSSISASSQSSISSSSSSSISSTSSSSLSSSSNPMLPIYLPILGAPGGDN